MRVALATPITGPLGLYGRAGADAVTLWAQDTGASLAVHDAHPDPLAALARADDADVVLGPYGSGPMRRIAKATHRLVWNHGAAQAHGPRVVPVLAPATSYLHGAVDAACAADPAIASAAVCHGDSGFARAVADGAVAAARARGLAVRRGDIGDDSPPADLLLVAGSFDTELDAARRLLPGAWRGAAFVGAGVDEVLAGLGDRREGLLGPAQWTATTAPVPDLGRPAVEFVEAYQRRTGEPPPYPAAQAYGAAVVAAHCREASTGDDDAMLEAALDADVTTLFGRFRLDRDSGEQVGHEVLTVQWQHGRRRVVHPAARAETTVRPRRGDTALGDTAP